MERRGGCVSQRQNLRLLQAHRVDGARDVRLRPPRTEAPRHALAGGQAPVDHAGRHGDEQPEPARRSAGQDGRRPGQGHDPGRRGSLGRHGRGRGAGAEGLAEGAGRGAPVAARHGDAAAREWAHHPGRRHRPEGLDRRRRGGVCEPGRGCEQGRPGEVRDGWDGVQPRGQPNLVQRTRAPDREVCHERGAGNGLEADAQGPGAARREAGRNRVVGPERMAGPADREGHEEADRRVPRCQRGAGDGDGAW